jgi:very-short-patch-repair endonuclease
MSTDTTIEGVVVGDPNAEHGLQPAHDQVSLANLPLQKAMAAARDRLLDRSLRNKLISTNIASERARQVRVFDRSSDEVFGLVQGGRVLSFVPGGKRAEGDPPAETIEISETSRGVGYEAETDDGSSRRRDATLQTRLTSEGLQKRLTSLFYEGQTIEEEQGVSVLFLAMGFLEWREAKQSEIARFAPLILLPVEITRTSAADRFKLKGREEDLFANVSLQAWMREQFGIELPELPDADAWLPSAYYDAVGQAIGERPGWALHTDEMVLGFFSFSKFLLWRDLDETTWPSPDTLIESRLLKDVLLRDDSDVLEDMPIIEDDECIDDVFKPIDLVHVTDADSSQAIAIQEAMAGKNLVIQGPPGTGKSQTITNIIAGAVKRGKRVLFIAEKMAALEVVHQRLVDRKLGPMCLELHSRKSSKAQVLEQIKQGRAAPAPPNWSPKVFDELQDIQQRLRNHSNRLHTINGLALTPFELIGRMCQLKSVGAPTPDFTLPDASEWSLDEIDNATRRAAGLGERLALAGPPASHPWRGLGGAAPDMLAQERLKPLVQATVDATERLSEVVARCREALDPTSQDTLSGLADWQVALAHLAACPAADEILVGDKLLPILDDLIAVALEGETLNVLRHTLDGRVRIEAWNTDWAGTRQIIAGQGRSLFRFLNRRYRDAVSDLRGVWIGDFPTNHGLRIETLDALIDGTRTAARLSAASTTFGSALGSYWRGESTDWALIRSVAMWLRRTCDFEPAIRLRVRDRLFEPDQARQLAASLGEAVSAAQSMIDALSEPTKLNQQVAFDGRDLRELESAEIAAIAHRWRRGLGDIVQWPAIRDDLTWLQEIGAQAFARQIFVGLVTASQVEGALLLAVYEAMWTKARALDPELERVAGDDLDRLVDRFRKADKDRIRIAADEVARAHIDQHPTGSAGAVGILIDETKKSRRLKPVRKLMEEAGEAIQRFKPVFLMSPLSVAQFLPPGRIEFDLLVIDEASQVRPEDALGAIARCRQLVVVGDAKQLPPTSFFSRMINDDDSDDDDADDVVEGQTRRAAVRDVESILNLCSRFPERMLRWHYRSEHPSLIATSNRNFYQNSLLLPPSVIAKSHDGLTGLMFHQVAPGGYERGRTARNEIEAEEVAQAALKHARQCPELTLGIGAFSVAQRDAIRDRLDHLARQHPALDQFMKGRAGKEPVFVKNLENIQGDERDVIFISIGYGRDRDGRLTQNFGPVGRDGGDRRLNVLITRARKRCEVFSSLVAEDIKFEGIGKPGVVALKEFLKLARDGFADLASATGRDFDSDFEESVATAIRRMGFECHPQVGMAGFFIDLGVIDPRTPDRYLLGVECDGAAYHSSRFARDRDRLRQQILESRGWKMHRIWSTDWFYRQEREIVKLGQALERALVGAPLPKAANVYDFEPFEDPPELLGVDEDAAEFDLQPIADDCARPLQALRPYEFADFSVAPRGSVEPHTLSDGQLAHIVERIVSIEQPIHIEEVGRRLAKVCGLQRAGSRIQEAALRGLRAARRASHLEADGPFWCEDREAPVLPRSRSELASAEYVRKPEMISSAELAAVAVIALEQNLALDRDELIVESARLIGFARTGKDVAAALDIAISDRLAGQLEADHLGRLRLKQL